MHALPRRSGHSSKATSSYSVLPYILEEVFNTCLGEYQAMFALVCYKVLTDTMKRVFAECHQLKYDKGLMALIWPDEKK